MSQRVFSLIRAPRGLGPVLIGLSCSLMLVPCALAAAPSTQPLPDPVDDVVFHEAMRARGLGSWLDLYLAAEPPADEVDASIRQRERVLFDAAKALPAEREAAIRQASQILADLIARHPAHSGRYRWQVELARDYLERQAPRAFEDVMLYELPGRDRGVVSDLSQRAVEVLKGLQAEIAQAWKSVETLDESSLVGLRDSGSLSMLEQIDAETATLLTWAKLHHALSASIDEPTRKAAFAQVLQELNDSGRLSLGSGREAEQAGALLLAAIAERKLGLFDQADGRARQMISVLGRISDKATRQRLRGSALVAVLEQIRALRDAGRFDAALQSAGQAREWAIKNRADEPSALIAVSLLQAGILERQQAAAQQQTLPADSTTPDALAWLKSASCVGMLEQTSRQSVAHRDALYSVLAPALGSAGVDAGLSPVALELLAGATVADARENPERVPGLQKLISSIRNALGTSGATMDANASVELRFLLGQALDLAGADLEAAQTLADLAEQAPKCDRADIAARHAVALAGGELRRAGESGSPASRALFVRTARLMRGRNPADSSIAELTYAIAAALENDARYEEAAGEYAAVPPGQRCSQQAALGRIRCWRRALEQTGASQASDGSEQSTRADRARAAVGAVREQMANEQRGASSQSTSSDSADCGRGQLLLAMAELLNHPSIDGSEQAAAILAESEGLFKNCPGLLGPALRQKIVALRQVKRLAEARAVVDQYLAADPEHAGSAMAGLLQSMHDEVLALLEKGDLASAKAVAGEAVGVGQSLLAWGAERPERLRPSDRLIIRLWHASALLQTGEASGALRSFEGIERDAGSVLPDDSGTRMLVQLGKADALFATGKIADALALYASIWTICPEHSQLWWHALVGNLRCHARLDADPSQVLASIKQQRFLAPDLGGKRWQREIAQIEQALTARTSTQPKP